MAIDIDTPPVYQEITKPPPHQMVMSDIWSSWFSSFYQTLVGYISQNGIFFPVLTTMQRDAIQQPINGQVIYNSTDDTAQYYKAGTWTAF